jgi:hypothetical protein
MFIKLVEEMATLFEKGREIREKAAATATQRYR